jgi:hypothetical protein
MIEQTDLVIDEWIYLPPANLDSEEKITSELTLEVMKKNAPSKKGLACRFTCRFVMGKDPVLLYIGQDSYVIDLEDKIDATEIRRMIGNSYSKFKEKYEFRKLGTVLQNTPMNAFNEQNMDIREILSLLN